MGRGAAVGLLLAVAVVVTTAGGCGGCDTECGEPAPADLVVLGTVSTIGADGVVRFELDDGQVLDVRVTGSTAGLFEDVRYRVPLFGSDDGGPPTASLPDDCSCGGPFITLPDGSEVRVAEPSVELRVLTLAVLGAAAGVMALWGLWRWHRGEPL
jgi:hypothetical protein